jgi:hypothetical protein
VIVGRLNLNLQHEVVYIANPGITGEASLDASVICVHEEDNTCFILGLDEFSYCITTTCGECSNPVHVAYKSCPCDASTCCVRYLSMKIYFCCPPLEDTRTIVSKVTITSLIFTILVFR